MTEKTVHPSSDDEDNNSSASSATIHAASSSEQAKENKEKGQLPSTPSDSAAPPKKAASHHARSRVYQVLSYTPKRCRYSPDEPFEFTMGLNILFAFAACFTVANLYYTHPILNLLAQDFHVTDEQASYIPTLAQAGYASGLLFLCPMADLLKRRPFVLWLVWFTATIWLGLCLTKSYSAFCAITYITGATTVTPQLMLPLVGQMAPPHRKATYLSIVVSGLVLGILVARVLSGIVANFIGWRYIYWIAFGLQYIILILLWLFMPDYPATNPGEKLWKRYPFLLWDIIKLLFTYPVLVQACLIGLLTASTFTSFWTTLTFLLAGEPYHYNSLIIGLFALIGIAVMCVGPVYARLVMEKRQPLFSVIVGELVCLAGVVLGTYTGKFTVVGPIIQAACIDVGFQIGQIANRTAIYKVATHASNRVNTAYMVSVFSGQLMGTAVGNALYARGGWVSSGSASVGFIAAALVVCLARGPHETGWIGWTGGYSMKKTVEPSSPESGSDHEQKPSDVESNAAETSAADQVTVQDAEKSVVEHVKT